MKEHYDFTKMKGEKNPYTKLLKESVMIELDVEAANYFKSLSEETGIPYATLINLYLRDCTKNNRKLNMKWAS